MKALDSYEVIIIGGSYAGLSAGLALGRARREVLIIDSHLPCNSQTPHSHNFLTQDGMAPAEIAALGKEQLKKYKTIHFFDGEAISAKKTETGFDVQLKSVEGFRTKKLILATGLRDVLPEIPGLRACWGISVIHCPYCHGYEFKDQATAVIGNGSAVVSFAKMISNWSRNLIVLTDGIATLTQDERVLLEKNQIQLVQTEIAALAASNGQVEKVVLKDGRELTVKAVYLRAPIQQHSDIPHSLGVEFTEQGLIKVTDTRKTTVPNLYACGDNSAMRSVATAVFTGSIAGVSVNLELIEESFAF